MVEGRSFLLLTVVIGTFFGVAGLAEVAPNLSMAVVVGGTTAPVALLVFGSGAVGDAESERAARVGWILQAVGAGLYLAGWAALVVGVRFGGLPWAAAGATLGVPVMAWVGVGSARALAGRPPPAPNPLAAGAGPAGVGRFLKVVGSEVIGLVAVGSLFSAAGIFIAWADPEEIVGGATVAGFFGACALVGVARGVGRWAGFVEGASAGLHALSQRLMHGAALLFGASMVAMAVAWTDMPVLLRVLAGGFGGLLCVALPVRIALDAVGRRDLLFGVVEFEDLDLALRRGGRVMRIPYPHIVHISLLEVHGNLAVGLRLAGAIDEAAIDRGEAPPFRLEHDGRDAPRRAQRRARRNLRWTRRLHGVELLLMEARLDRPAAHVARELAERAGLDDL